MSVGQLEILIELWRERAKHMLVSKGISETYTRCADELENLIKEIE